jgi:putative acetyltransferase
MTSLTVRPEEAKDIEQVRALVRASFPTDAESRLVDALRANSKAVISLVAVQDEQVLGHVLFSPVSTSPPAAATGIGLAPVAVLTAFQSQGIGAQLIREGLRHSQEMGYDFCVVLGDPRYYRRFGFEKASPLGLQNEYGADDAFMVIRFTDRALAPGLVRYADEFRAFAV